MDHGRVLSSRHMYWPIHELVPERHVVILSVPPPPLKETLCPEQTVVHECARWILHINVLLEQTFKCSIVHVIQAKGSKDTDIYHCSTDKEKPVFYLVHHSRFWRRFLSFPNMTKFFKFTEIVKMGIMH